MTSQNQLEYLTTLILPDDGEKVLCFGHHTLCCKDDMEKNPDWHEVIFRLRVTSYRLKQQYPIDPEESMLQEYSVDESWDSGDEDEDGFVIGVTRWKHIFEDHE